MKWLVAGNVTISVHTEVEAADRESAVQEALSRPMMSLCHQCAAGEPQEEWVTSGELDGDVEQMEVEALEQGETL